MALAPLVLDKLREQIDRADHLLGLVPPDRIDWRPDAAGNAATLGELAGHLLECLAGFCAVLYAWAPDRLGHFQELRRLPVNHRCPPEDARRRIQAYLKHIEEGFAILSDSDLARPVSTRFAPEGVPLLSVLLGNLEHLINHKHQLFFYLKLLGVAVRTADLYRF